MIKKKLFFIAILIISIVLFVLLFFSGLFGAPLYWKINYDKYYMDNFYNNGTLLELDSDNYNDIGIRYSKYCKNLNSVIIRDTVESFDYFSYMDLKKLQYIYICGNLNDWSFLKKCTNLETLYIDNSNFSDFSLLDECSELQSLLLATNHEVNYSGIEKLKSLKSLSLALKEYDMNEICKLNSLQSLYFSNNPINDYELLKEMNLNDLGFSNYENSEKFLVLLRNSESISNIFFTECSFSMSEDKLRSLINTNLKVDFDNCIFDD